VAGSALGMEIKPEEGIMTVITERKELLEAQSIHQTQLPIKSLRVRCLMGGTKSIFLTALEIHSMELLPLLMIMGRILLEIL
jgi:hypothetical protein